MESKNRSSEAEEKIKDSNPFDREIKLFQIRICSLQQSQTRQIYPVFISSLDIWLQERWKSMDKSAGILSMEPNVALVFFVRTIIEVLLVGSLTEKEIRGGVVDVCKDVGVKSTARGSIAGLSLDLSTACCILSSLGVLEPDVSTSVQAEKTESITSLRRRYLAPMTPIDAATNTSVGPIENSLDNVHCPIGGLPSTTVTTTSTVSTTLSSAPPSVLKPSTLPFSALALNSNTNDCGTLGAVEAENKAFQILRCGQDSASSGTSCSSCIVNSDTAHVAGGVLLFECLTNRWRASLETYLKDSFASRAKLAAAAASKAETVSVKPISTATGASNDSTDLEPDADVDIDDCAAVMAHETIGDSNESRGHISSGGIDIIQRENTTAVSTAGNESIASSSAKSTTMNENPNASTLTSIAGTSGTQVEVPPLDVSSIVYNSPALSKSAARLEKTLPVVTNGISGAGLGTSRKDKGPVGTGSGSRPTKRSVNQRVWKLSEDITPLLHPEDLLKELLRASHEEAAVLEIEEILLRKLAGQCGFEMPSEPYRPGTAYLIQTPAHEQIGIDADLIKVGKRVGTLKSGAKITAVDLWEKARLAYLKRKARARGLTASAITRPDVINSLTAGFPFHHPSKIKEEGVEIKKDRRSTPSSSQSNSASTSAMLTDIEKGFMTSYMNAKMRSFVPILSIANESEFSDNLTLKGSIYTTQHPANLSYSFGANYNPIEATVIRPDIELRTAPMPWKAIAAEFMTLDHKDFGDPLNTINTVSQKSGRLNDAVISHTNSIGEFSTSTSARLSHSYCNLPPCETKPPTLCRSSSTSAMQATQLNACGLEKSGQVIGRSTSVDSAMNLPRLQAMQETIDLNSCNHSLQPISVNRIATVLAPRFSQIIPISKSNFQTWSLKRVNMELSPNKEVDNVSNYDSNGEAGDEVEDINDETMKQKHHAVLRKMRDRWKQLQQLRQERKSYLMRAGINKNSNYGYSTDGSSYNSGSPRGSYSESETIGRPSLISDESRSLSGQRKRGRGRPPKTSHSHTLPQPYSHTHSKRSHSDFSDHQLMVSDTNKEDHQPTNANVQNVPIEFIAGSSTRILEIDPNSHLNTVETVLTIDRSTASKRQRRSPVQRVRVNLKKPLTPFKPSLLANNIHLIANSPGNSNPYRGDSSDRPVEGTCLDNGVGRQSPGQAKGRGHHLKTPAAPSPNYGSRTTLQS